LTELKKNSKVLPMSNRLEEALSMSQAAIEAGLADARTELAELRVREETLQALIARAEAALGFGDSEPEGDGAGHLTLHAALEQILREHDNRWMTVRELSNEINRRGLYLKKDGTPVEPNQVHARTKNYDTIFEKDGPRVRLRIAAHTWNVVIFKDDDTGFFDWQDANRQGFFINTERKPNPNYLVLHMSGCGHFKGAPSVRWTKDYIKICSAQRDQLEGWATQIVGGEVTLCKSCFS
jgi:HB1, ASXL, restriction endonuclease HTH domain